MPFMPFSAAALKRLFTSSLEVGAAHFRHDVHERHIGGGNRRGMGFKSRALVPRHPLLPQSHRHRLLEHLLLRHDAGPEVEQLHRQWHQHLNAIDHTAAGINAAVDRHGLPFRGAAQVGGVHQHGGAGSNATGASARSGRPWPMAAPRRNAWPCRKRCSTRAARLIAWHSTRGKDPGREGERRGLGVAQPNPSCFPHPA